MASIGEIGVEQPTTKKLNLYHGISSAGKDGDFSSGVCLSGFDVDEEQGNYVRMVVPIDLKKRPRALVIVKKLSEIAINMYNTDHVTNYKVTNIVKVNSQLIAGFKHYITFEALDVANNAGVKTFQALGFQLVPDETRPDGLEVEFCRVKSTDE